MSFEKNEKVWNAWTVLSSQYIILRCAFFFMWYAYVIMWSAFVIIWCAFVIIWCGFVIIWCAYVLMWCAFVSMWCAFVVMWCAFDIMWCAFIIMWCAFVVIWCANVLMWCAFVIMWCAFVIMWCAFVVMGCAFVIMWCAFVVMWGAGAWTLHCLTFNAFLISDVLYSRTVEQSGSSWYKGLIMSSKVKRSGSFSTENATWSQLIDPPSYDKMITSEVEGFRGCAGDWQVWDSNETETYRYTNIVFIIRKEMIHFYINLFKGKQ